MLRNFNRFSVPNYLTKNIFNKTKYFRFSSSITSESFASGTNAIYIEHLYSLWLANPSSVDISWQNYFTNVERNLPQGIAFQSPPTIDPSFSLESPNQSLQSIEVNYYKIQETLRLLLLIRTYQYQGFLDSNIDPLNLKHTEQTGNKFKEQLEKVYLDYRTAGFTEQDLDKEFLIYDPNIGGIRAEQKSFKLKDIIDILNRAYCGSIGVEFMHLLDNSELNYFRDKFENEWSNYKVEKESLLQNFENVAKAVLFEEFLKNKFTTHKRFGLEGLETVITGLEAYVDKSVELGVRDVTLGMPHRGRLNVLANVFKKPVSKIIGEFQGKITNDALKEGFYAGDVKYHLGTYNEREYDDGTRVLMVIYCVK